MKSLLIQDTTGEEREKYIQETFRCINDCDMCGICKIYLSKDPMDVYADYIEGKREFLDIAKEYR